MTFEEFIESVTDQRYINGKPSHELAPEYTKYSYGVLKKCWEEAAKSRWTPVAERLPKYYRKYPILTLGHQSSYFSKLGFDNIKATHWMDLPEDI